MRPFAQINPELEDINPRVRARRMKFAKTATDRQWTNIETKMFFFFFLFFHGENTEAPGCLCFVPP